MLGCARLCSTVPGLAGSSARRSFSPHLIKARVPRNYTINFFLYSPISFCNQFRDVSFGVWLMSWNYTNLDFESSGFLQRPLLAVRFNGIFWCLSVYHKIASVLYFHLFFLDFLYTHEFGISTEMAHLNLQRDILMLAISKYKAETGWSKSNANILFIPLQLNFAPPPISNTNSYNKHSTVQSGLVKVLTLNFVTWG